MSALVLTPLTDADLDAILAWRYPDALAVYDSRAEDRALLADPANAFLAIRPAGAAELLGHVCTGPEARVPGMHADAGLVDVGVGLRPDAIGQGRSRALLPALLAELTRRAGGEPLAFRAAVARWNGRARAAVEHAGFRATGEVSNANGTYVVYVRPAGPPLDAGA